MYYYYTDIVFIDKEQSLRRKILCFYTNKGHARYLPFDKEGKIYETFINKCHNVLDKEDFANKYPNIKI